MSGVEASFEPSTCAVPDFVPTVDLPDTSARSVTSSEDRPIAPNPDERAVPVDAALQPEPTAPGEPAEPSATREAPTREAPTREAQTTTPTREAPTPAQPAPETPDPNPGPADLAARTGDAPRRRPGGTVAIAVLAALVGAAAGATLGALLAVHLGRHSGTTMVRETLPAPDRVARVNDIPSILARVEPTVVSIRSDQSSGTGLIVSPSGEVLTNYHVIAGANYIHVLLFHQNSSKTAAVIGYDQTDDLALLQVEGVGDLPAAVLGDSGQVAVGADVLAIGNALDLPGGLTATAGIVSGLDRTIDSSALPSGASAPPDLIESDAAINPGNSGGPLVDADGDVIGINTLLINNLAFAIPIDTVKALLPALSAGSRAATVSLGIGLLDDTGPLAGEYGLGVTRGALVSEVTPGSPAAQAGMQVYDVIVGFDGQPVADSAQLMSLLAGRHPADVVPVTVVRGKLTLHKVVVLGAGA